MLDQPKKIISIVTHCYNEEENAAEVCRQVKEVFNELPQYDYEHIFIDNASKDKTVNILKAIAAEDNHVKIIVNTRNFGPICSAHHALLQAQGDAAVMLAADLQDPPALIKDFIGKWEKGYKIVIGVKIKSEGNRIMFAIRKIYYNLIKNFAEIEQIKNFAGFGLYDKKFIEILKKFDDPYPYFRGLITEIGFPRAEIEYIQPERIKGKSSCNLYILYDMAMLGFVNHSKVPLRLASFIGFGMSIMSFLVGLIYLFRKLLNWEDFQLGLAPIVVGIFFIGSIQLFFIGVLGEYIGSIYTQVKHRPLVIEKERINFDK